MKDVSFDQYQRYNNVAEIINRSRKDPTEKFRILEVGANQHRNLEYFLPDDSIYYLDIELPEELLDDKQFFLGDATAMEFEDDTFDIIVALDVFEHIPAAKREEFIKELTRVSSQIYILTAPFYSEKVVEVEDRTNKVYRTLFNENYRWLEEHIINGLPKLHELQEQLSQMGLHFEVISHGDLYIWEKLMGIHFIAAWNRNLAEYRQIIDNYYIKHIYQKDYVTDSYRKIVAVSVGRLLDKIFYPTDSFIEDTVEIKHLDYLITTFYHLANIDRNQLRESFEEEEKSKDWIQIYINKGDGFKETDSYKKDITPTSLVNNLTYRFENVEEITEIRIDPSVFSGAFRINSLKIEDVNNVSCTEYIIEGNYTYYSKNTMVFDHEDPNIIIKFLKPLLLKEVSVEITYLSRDTKYLIMEHDEVIRGKDEEIEEVIKLRENEKSICREMEDDKNTLYLQLVEEKVMREIYEKQNEELRVCIRDMESRHHGELILLSEDVREKDKYLMKLVEEIQATSEKLIRSQLTLDLIYQSRSWKWISRIKQWFGRR